jgi:glyoxylate/hydroxypyruvate reductase
MSIAIIFNNKDPKPWASGLKAKLPSATIEVYPNISKWDDVTFALCWKPDENVLSKFPNLSVVQSVGASIEHITRTQNISDGVQLTRVVDDNLSNDMWEFLLTGVLSHLKNFSLYAKQKESEVWKQMPYREIKTTTVSILGLGKIGSFVAERFSTLNFTVKGWSASKKNIPNVQSYVGVEELTPFLNGTDILINLLPLTYTTENILNKSNLAKTNEGSFLINVGRGEHLVENDVLELLKESHLSGALLDVFIQEPLPQDHPFWSHPKIQITPHVASLTNIESATTQIVENYMSHITGKNLQNTVSLKKGY